jgi:hypothetical protein
MSVIIRFAKSPVSNATRTVAQKLGRTGSANMRGFSNVDGKEFSTRFTKTPYLEKLPPASANRPRRHSPVAEVFLVELHDISPRTANGGRDQLYLRTLRKVLKNSKESAPEVLKFVMDQTWTTWGHDMATNSWYNERHAVLTGLLSDLAAASPELRDAAMKEIFRLETLEHIVPVG